VSPAATRHPLLAAGPLPLFPLNTVLFPGGILPLRVFEQRYIAMAKACIANDAPFGVCLITSGDEVLRDAAQRKAPEFATIGTAARIVEWDMPQTGILHVRAEGLQRFEVERHGVAQDGLVEGVVAPIPPEPSRAIDDKFAPLVKLLGLVATRVGPQRFPSGVDEHGDVAPRAGFDDASWVGYRLAEVLPLPLKIKQSMLEINDAEVRLTLLMRFLADHGLV